MLSDSAYDQIKNRSDVGVVGLGRFRLKNVGRPFELYAVSADGVVVPDPARAGGQGRAVREPAEQPARAGRATGRSGRRPGVARRARRANIGSSRSRAPAASGRPASLVELGRLLAPEFLDGVAFVALADVTDPADFLPALAEALDVKEAEERTLGDGVVALIGDRKALLLLDNLEQVVAAAPEVARLDRDAAPSCGS